MGVVKMLKLCSHVNVGNTPGTSQK